MKLSFKTFFSTASLIVFFSSSPFSAIAQCKSALKEGIKKLSPYTHTGQINTVTLILDEPSEIHLSFYKGLNYKFQIGAEEVLGKVTFRVLDEYKTEIYNSATSTNPTSWVFYSNSTQNLIIEIYAVEKGKQGCAYLVVGMQQPKSTTIRTL